MIDYIVFFSLLFGVGVLCLVFRPKSIQKDTWVDWELCKCQSPIERRMYKAVKDRYYTKTQFPEGRYRIDVALPTYRIAIECDGRDYHSTPAQKAHDRKKNAFLRSRGWTVFRFSGSDIHKNMPKLLAKVETVIQNRSNFGR